MAKKCMIERQKKRRVVVDKYAGRRKELKARVKDFTLSMEERQQAVEALQKLPRDASPTRLRNRCNQTGRPRGYYRKFGLSRNKLRETAVRGEIPGLTKASW
jgi:small subunit ribosomal protein S14